MTKKPPHLSISVSDVVTLCTIYICFISSVLLNEMILADWYLIQLRLAIVLLLMLLYFHHIMSVIQAEVSAVSRR